MVSKRLDFDIIAHDKASAKFDAVGKASEGAGAKMKKFAAVGALAVGAAAVVAGKALFDMTKAAAEDAAGQARLAKTLQNTTKATDAQIASTEDWIARTGKALGVADDQMRPALEKLAIATGDLSEAQNLLSLATDVSAGSGKSLEAVSMALAKAATGNVGALGRLGIATKDAAGQTKSFDQITKDLGKTFAGQASAQANTLQGKIGRLKLMFDETKEAIGARLLPVAERLAGWFIDEAVPAFDKASKWLGDQLAPATDDVKAAFKDAQPFLELAGKILTNVVGPAAKWIAEKAFPLLGGAAKNMGRSLRAVGEAGTWMWNNALQPVFKVLSQAVAKSMEMFGHMLQVVGKGTRTEWIEKMGDKLVGAAKKADDFANSIDKLDGKSADVSVRVRYYSSGRQPNLDSAAEGLVPRAIAPAPRSMVGPAPRAAVGRTAGSGEGGMAQVVNLLQAILDNQLTDGSRLVLSGFDAGQQAYLRTGAF